MDIKSFIKDTAEKERYNHRITNIMMVALLSLVIVFTLCFGVKVNIGSAVFGDEKDVFVNQNIFQIADVVINNDMSKEEAVKYVEEVNKVLDSKYDIIGVTVSGPLLPIGGEQIDEIAKVRDVAIALGKDASKINLIKYKFAVAVAVGNPVLMEHKQSQEGSRIYSQIGQLLIISLVQLAFMLISLVMLVFAIIALVKKKTFTKGKLSIMLLLILSLINIILFSSISFISIGWAGVLSMVFIFLVAIMFGLIKHALMDKKDFSFSMCIHNAVLAGGGLLALVLFLSPLFRLTTDTGASMSLGWAYLFDYTLAELSYMSAVMAYSLTQLLMFGLLLLPVTLLTVFTLINTARFLSADYQHNERRVFTIVMLVVDALIFLLMIVYSANGSLNISSLYISVKLSLGIVIPQILVIVGMLVFQLVYKVKPVKKEIVFK